MPTKKKNNDNNTNNNKNNSSHKQLPQADLSTKRKEIFDLKIEKKKVNH